MPGLELYAVPRLKLNVLCFTFITVCFSLLNSHCHSLKTGHIKCESFSTSSCRCLFPNGEGYDLSSLDRKNNWFNASKDNLTFYFHPCTDISIGNKSDVNGCFTGASVCLFNRTNHQYKTIGFANETSIVSSGLRDPVSLEYNHGGNVTAILLKCASSGDTSLEIQNIEDPQKYELALSSPAGCRQQLPALKEDPSEGGESHLSTGSVLVIMFVVFTSLYFVGGALTLKYLRGAEGVEMIPNYEFWMSLPGLVKEGFLFAVSGCKAPQAYDRI